MQGQRKGGRRRADGDQQGGGHERSIVGDVRRQPHRRHAQVMHAGDSEPHEQAGGEDTRPVRAGVGDDDEGRPGHGDGDHQRQGSQTQVVGDGHPGIEGEHGDEVHRPDAQAHGDGGRGKPPGPARPALARTRRKRSNAV